MASSLQKLPPIAVKGLCTFTMGKDEFGNECISFKQSPMITKYESAEYVGIGINAFMDLVRAGDIARRSKGHRAFHVDDLDDYLEQLKEGAY